jgi:hypothetical protein
MANKKKNKKKSKTPKKSASRKPTSAKKVQKRAIKKKSVKTTAPNKAGTKKKRLKTTSSGKASRTANIRTRSRERGLSAFSPKTSGSRLGDQSGDLQGLSNIESVDSESVDELLEEGNAFEAEVVSGVEKSGEPGVREVRTREVPEDDVPAEYLDEE